MEITKATFLDTMEEVLLGEVNADYITKSEMKDYIKDIKKFIKNAKTGDIYYYSGNAYIITNC